jgi:MoxR-like ATPase
MNPISAIQSVDMLQNALREQRYIADRGLATAIYLALKIGRPLFLEGEAGVGKTEVAKVLTDLLKTDLIRLQCYEGLDVQQAVYEWTTRQMMHPGPGSQENSGGADLFSPSSS